MFQKLIARYLRKDHALASITAALIFVSTFVTDILPLLGPHLSSGTAATVVLVGSLCATIGGYVQKMPSLTWAGMVTLGYQIITLLIVNQIGRGTRVEVALITIAGLIKLASKFTVITSTSPLATGASTDVGRERTQTKP